MRSQDISVIVQGAIDKKNTQECLQSIRKYLPDAEIILSTWEGQDTSDIEKYCDNIIFNKDPGAVFVDKINLYNNMNRQLLSVQEGLKVATKKYALKLRSDLVLSNNTFLNYFDEFPARSSKYNLFTHKIFVPTLFTRLYLYDKIRDTRGCVPFHISDWWFLGLKEDLDRLFLNTPLVKEPEFTKYFLQDENMMKNNPYFGVSCDFKFAPEQYFGYMPFARAFKDIYMEDASDYSDDIMEKYKEAFVNNFVVLEFNQSGIYLNKYYFSKNEKALGKEFFNLCNRYNYEKVYKKFCDSTYTIKTNSFFYENIKCGYALVTLEKHCTILVAKDSSMKARVEQIFVSIPVSFLKFIITVCAEFLKFKK